MTVTVVGIGGSIRSDSQSERALRVALAGARELGAQTVQYSGPELVLPFYDPSVPGWFIARRSPTTSVSATPSSRLGEPLPDPQSRSPTSRLSFTERFECPNDGTRAPNAWYYAGVTTSKATSGGTLTGAARDTVRVDTVAPSLASPSVSRSRLRIRSALAGASPTTQTAPPTTPTAPPISSVSYSCSRCWPSCGRSCAPVSYTSPITRRCCRGSN